MKKIFIILLCLLTLSGCKHEENENEIIENNPPKDQPVEDQKVAFDVVDYTVYSAKTLSNRFAIVKVRIKNDKAINYSLSDITTSENLNLAECENYIDDLNKKGFIVSSFKISDELKSDNTSAVFNLFVPIEDKDSKEIKLVFDKQYEVTVDLSKNTQVISSEYVVEESVIEDEEFQITVKNVYNTLGEALYENGELSYYPAFSEIYAIQIKIVSLNGEKVTITEAEYVTSDNNSFVAMDKKFSTERAKNIINETVKNTKEGYLLFETSNPDKEPITYQGILRLKVNGKWHNIDVEL